MNGYRVEYVAARHVCGHVVEVGRIVGAVSAASVRREAAGRICEHCAEERMARGVARYGSIGEYGMAMVNREAEAIAIAEGRA